MTNSLQDCGAGPRITQKCPHGKRAYCCQVLEYPFVAVKRAYCCQVLEYPFVAVARVRAIELFIA